MKKKAGLCLILLGLLLDPAGAVSLDLAPQAKASLQIQGILPQLVGNRLTLQIRLPPQAHVYAVHLPPGLGPQPSQVILEPAWVVPAKNLTEQPPQQLYDQAYETRLLAHEGDFWVQVRLAEPPKLPLRGVFRYQICSQTLCSLPLDAAFEVK